MAHLLWTVIAATVSVASAITTPTLISQPIFDLRDLGRVGIAGDFDGVSIYEYSSQAQLSPFANRSQTLLTQLPNGLFTSLGLAPTDEAISSMCVYELKDGTMRGVVVGGNFTSLGGVQANGIALYDPGSNKATAMGDFQGSVNALLCDKTTNRVYVGGNFEMNKTKNAIAWEDGQWKDLPFEGFTGPVNTITRSNNNTILFGGNFDGLQNFSAPTIRDAQPINIGSAVITAEQTTDLAGFNDPAAITCTNNTARQWLLRDGQLGSWTASFRFELFPTKLSLINANYQGRSTETFRLTAFPLGGIMNLTYTDAKGNKQHCDASCPLQAIDTVQDFEFVNTVGMKSVRLDILAFRGAGAGLSSVQLFQNDIFAYAIPELNGNSCAANATRSESIVSGTWSETTIDPQGDADYLSTEIDSANISSSAIVFEPYIVQSGRYQILVYTPGCIQDGTCATRGAYVASGTVTKDGSNFTYPSRIFQTNYYDKYDTIYDGDVDATSGAFRPRVTLAPAPQQPSDTVELVAQKIQFRLVSETKTSQAETQSNNATASSSRLNGIYEYDPTKTETTNPADSRINGAGLTLRENASVSSIIVHGDFTYVGGNLTASNDKFQNFFSIDKNADNLPTVPESGLNGVINTMLAVGDVIYVGGAFTGTKDGSTKGVTHFGAYDTSKNSWVALGAGVNGLVTDIVQISLNMTSRTEVGIAVSGDFTQVLPNSNVADAVDADGFAVWVPSQQQWLETMGDRPELSGLLSAVVQTGNNSIYAGSMASSSLASSGAVFLLNTDSTTLAPSSLNLTSAPAASSRKRSITANLTGVVTGLFYAANGKNLTVLGGNFEAEGQNGTVRNLAFLDGNNNGEVTGATDEFTADSTILAMAVLDSLLFVGGSLNGSSQIGGIAVWDLSMMHLADAQPQPLSGDNAIVYDISLRPDSQDIYVAGDFASAGSLGCANLCIYQNSQQQWTDASSETPGVINVMKWISPNLLMVGGDMKMNNTDMSLAVYDVQLGQFIPFDADITNIPGPVNSISVDSDDSRSLFISGTFKNGTGPFLMKLKDKKFVLLDDNFDNTTEIHSIQVLTVRDNSKHQATDYVQDNHILLITGALNLNNFGNASAVTFDGTNWKPFMLAAKSNGEPGTISTFFSQYEVKFPASGKRLAKGYVILISLAIALALVFLIVVCGVLASYIRRRREGYQPAPTMVGAEKSVNMQERLPPQEFLRDIDTPGGRGRGSPMI
ncbi:cortical protein marker for cell polarity-domain-containing protein [Sphaerosporella brunnea]|uniref:Cortical protein marker for cell polarity-domain-containing protein n=1 Tax=Sphaerosporella brunnea TaxID=1250544 RepID=A0A5J5EWH6_9PEZI|nr:cortical protein marker for cell polarity-domain-containing protein [Sphaerosporella brunnea]